MNDINFPAGILQPPFFDFNIDPAVNFGGIGVVIGHEMTHGFDDQGSKYDGKGNLREWQTADDRKKFVERTDCEADGVQRLRGRSRPRQSPQQKLNGKLTLGENTADNGGLRIAYMALLDTLAPKARPSTTRSTATPRSSATSSASPRCGARTRPSSPRASGRSPIRTRRAAGASTAPCRTSTNSARPSAAPKASPCTRKTPAASGSRHICAPF